MLLRVPSHAGRSRVTGQRQSRPRVGAVAPAAAVSARHQLQRQRWSQQQLLRPQPLRRSRHATAAAAADAASTVDLQRQLAAKEAELAAMFDSGKPMPQASIVATLRAEIAALEDQLAGRPVQPLVKAGPVSGAGFGGPTASRPAAPSGPGLAPMRTRTEELAFKAYEMVEQELRSNQGMGQKDDMEMAQLEAENSTLRAQAYSLLQRQQQLETMLAEVQGAKPPELLLETTEDLLARMRSKLEKAA